MHILWDFDGTLFNTYPIYQKLMKEVLPDRSEQEILAHIKISFTHAFSYFHMTVSQIRAFRDLMHQVPAKAVQPFDGLENVLSSAEKHVIMTHNNRHDVLQVLKYHQLDSYFNDIVAYEDGFPKKPDPASYVYLDRKYGIDLVIGDRLLDIISGRKIGSRTCLFQNRQPGADFYLEDYREFFNVINNNF
ncbi:HAD-IA family hydrolase [Sporolactobacillus sp. Y61]|uniref:HAD-IA family hydrolase n=1 Tax=Sporolactobacillus sp. Y61 TaxID=3160863 RepID=A0AAU8IG18_9BACL